MPEKRLPIVATQYCPEGAAQVLLGLRRGAVIELHREEFNEVDRLAVACFSGGTKVGYLPMHSRGPVSAALDAGRAVTAKLVAEAIGERNGVIETVLARDPPRILVTWEDGELSATPCPIAAKPIREPQTHDYTQPHWGHKCTIQRIEDAGQRASATGHGAGIDAQDYLILKNGDGVTRYRVARISYFANPPDQWVADLEFAPRPKAETDG